MITQVIYNLLENAAKFARTGTALYLGVTAAADGKAYVTVQHPQRPGAVDLPRRQQVDGLLRLLGGPLPPHHGHREDRQREKQRRQQEAHPRRVPPLRVL